MSQRVFLEDTPELILLDLDSLEEVEYDYDSEEEFLSGIEVGEDYSY